jgi:hypothetical protein
LLAFAGRVLAAGSDDELVEAMRPFGAAVVAGPGACGVPILSQASDLRILGVGLARVS